VSLAIALLVAQAAPPPAEKPPVAPWKGSLADGLREMRKLSDAGKPDDALAVADRILTPDKFATWREETTAKPGWKRTLVEDADPVLAAVGLSDLSPVERATVHFARGVVLAHAEKRGEAGEAFEKSRALAGPGDLRLDATYDLGWTALEEGETLRKQIPELGGTPPGQPPQPAQPGQPTSPQAQLQQQLQGQAPQGPDPLQLARAAYTLARERFVERLKADARDPDSRANVELAQKRLKELAEIQKKREEEKQKQEQQKKDQQKKDQDKKDQDKQDKDQQKKDDAQDPNKDQKSDEQKKKEEEQKKEQEDQKKKEQEKKDAKPDASKDQLLTKEEIMRLLDTLKDREEEGKKLMERLKRANRAKVKKDW
jgi:hypothetical protein